MPFRIAQTHTVGAPGKDVQLAPILRGEELPIELEGSEGQNTQLTLGKDLFLKGFDKQLTGVRKDEEKTVEAVLPENFPEKDLVNKTAKFNCKITAVKKPEPVEINDEFAKNLGAKDLNDTKRFEF